ncbi:hypothetical protein ACTA71_006520 [Dictyostelium dimigraforme]
MIFKYFENPNCSNQENSPLTIILGFAGGSERLIKSYSNLWSKRGFNCLLLCQTDVEFNSYFYIDYSNKIVKFIENYNKNPNQIICFHCLSIGNTLFSYFLKYIQDNKQYSYILNLIKGTVYDIGPLIDGKDHLCGYYGTFGTLDDINKYSISPYSEKPFQFLYKCWEYQCKHYYPCLISPNNKWHHLVITSPNDMVTISIETFLEQLITNNTSLKKFQNDGNNDNNNNNNNKNNNNFYLIKKVFGSNHCCHLPMNPKEYEESINQLIDLLINKSKL